MKEKTNPLFTKENAEKIFVPQPVEDDLCTIISDKLTSAGFYYRLAYRVKSAESIEEKLVRRNYGAPGTQYEDKKLQDLIGLRIILYFEDDMPIVRNLLDTLFSEPGEWEASETSVYEFRAMKLNGTFKLPVHLQNMIVTEDLSEYIDNTFEVQIRTNAFEGWHEVEHDLHYKGSALNEDNAILSRRMNSILATLELCDDSLVSLTEDLGHYHYKSGNWEDMIRCHYRAKFINEDLKPEIKDFFNENPELAKKMFKCERRKLFESWWHSNIDKELHTVNNAVKAINEKEIHDERLTEIFTEFNKRSQPVKRKKFEPFKPLGRFPVFLSSVLIDTEKEDIFKAFDKSVEYIYQWIKSRHGEIFTDLPDEVSEYKNETLGYRIIVKYDKEKMFFSELTTHPDTNVANRLWLSKAKIEERDGKLEFTVTNHFAEQVEKYRDPKNGLFSRPNFYGEIADNIGIIDVYRLKETAEHIVDSKLNDLYELIYSGRRHCPVIVFMVNDKSWADRFDIEYFSFLVGYYAHVYIIDDETAKLEFATEYNMDKERYRDSITVFYVGEKPVTSYKRDILETSFEVTKFETKKYWNEKGCRAFRRQLISDIRDKMVESEFADVYSDDVVLKSSQAKEEWDVCNEHGEKMGFTIERADARELKGHCYHKVVCVYTITNDGKILITRRSAAKSHPHRWEIPCGSVLAGETESDGAVRELFEETGVKAGKEELIPLYVFPDSKRHCIYYSFIVKLKSSKTDVVISPDEADDYQFMKLEDFYKFIKTDEFAKSEAGRFAILGDRIKNAIKESLNKD